ncbi:BTAD domain-containing putative transcriptional regulator [Actinomadura geliboluensis]|uniref:BTAD domain-containing putative transcriptional regulator n=1 Tax=Actinomadura geliboluensis TaxID=882440 RepID=UPI0036C9A7EE
MEVVALPDEGPSTRFEILGRTAAWRDGRELDLGPGKQRAVLAVLLLTPGRPVPTASIVRAVWGDEPPDNGANVVQKYVAGLRRVLEPDRSPRAPGRLLALTGAGYALHVPPGGLDAEVFQDRVKAARSVRDEGDAAGAEAMLREALAMWRGPALAGLNGAFFDAARDRLEETRAAALEACAEAGLDVGEHARLVPELLRLVAEFPLREGFRYLLMLALYRCGRQAEALAAYRDARDFFAAEFGVEPGERLQSLHLGILRSDPSLAGPSPASPSAAAEQPARPEAAAPAAPPFAPPDPALDPPLDPPLDPRPSPAVGVVPLAPMAAAHPHLGAPAAPHLAAEHPVWAPPVGRHVPWPLRAVLAALPVLSFGMLTSALVAYYAARRRSRPLALMAGGYLALSAFFVTGILSITSEEPTLWDGPVFLALILTMLGGAVHLAVLTADPYPGAGPPVPDVRLIEGRVRRAQARSLAAHHPSIARTLGIGRPDLPRTFDDGGLVDVNAAPEHLLAALPGVDPHHAKLIVLARAAHGPLASVDDLATRNILPYETVHALRDMLITVPPAPDATDAEPEAAPPSVEPAPKP